MARVAQFFWPLRTPPSRRRRSFVPVFAGICRAPSRQPAALERALEAPAVCATSSSAIAFDPVKLQTLPFEMRGGRCETGEGKITTAPRPEASEATRSEAGRRRERRDSAGGANGGVLTHAPGSQGFLERRSAGAQAESDGTTGPRAGSRIEGRRERAPLTSRRGPEAPS